jgi:hypothetical protein
MGGNLARGEKPAGRNAAVICRLAISDIQKRANRRCRAGSTLSRCRYPQSQGQSSKNCEKRQNLHQMRPTGDVWPDSVLKYRQSNESQPVDPRERRDSAPPVPRRGNPVRSMGERLAKAAPSHIRAPEACARPARALPFQTGHAGEERTCRAAGKIWLRPTGFIGTAQCATAATPSALTRTEDSQRRRTVRVCWNGSNCLASPFGST